MTRDTAAPSPSAWQKSSAAKSGTGDSAIEPAEPAHPVAVAIELGAGAGEHAGQLGPTDLDRGVEGLEQRVEHTLELEQVGFTRSVPGRAVGATEDQPERLDLLLEEHVADLEQAHRAGAAAAG